MRLNNKGIAISSIMYIILVLAAVLMILTLSVLSSKKLISDKIKEEAMNDVLQICKGVTQETKTTGYVPVKGEYKMGDEYICKVAKDVYYHFFVLSVDGERVNLILDRNINSDGTLATSSITKENAVNGVYSVVPWISKTDYESANTDGTTCETYNADGVEHTCVDEGPVTAINFLNKATEGWINIPSMNEVFFSEHSGQNIDIQFKGKARLITKAEVGATGCSLNSGDEDHGTCPLWMVNYLSNHLYNYYPTLVQDGGKVISNMDIYWTLTTAVWDHYSVFAVHAVGNVSNYSAVIDPNKISGAGVRPVITVLKDNLVL